MQAPPDINLWSILGPGTIGAALGVVGTAIAALFMRGPAMQQAINGAAETLIQGQQAMITDLRKALKIEQDSAEQRCQERLEQVESRHLDYVGSTSAQLAELRKTLSEQMPHTGFGA